MHVHIYGKVNTYFLFPDEGKECYKGESSSSPQSCPIGSLKCLLLGLKEFSRTMNELEYQLDLSDTIDSGNVTGLENDISKEHEAEFPNILNEESCQMPQTPKTCRMSESEGGPQKVAKAFDDFSVQLCEACSSSLPLVSIIFTIFSLL